jgi:hypothetical protein
VNCEKRKLASKAPKKGTEKKKTMKKKVMSNLG